jgi:hypothetical protein
VLGGTELDGDTGLAEDVSGPQYVRAVVDRVGQVVQPAAGPGVWFTGDGKIVGLAHQAEPGAGFGLSRRDQVFAELEAEAVAHQSPGGRHVLREDVDVVDAGRGDASCHRRLGLVRQVRGLALGGVVLLRFVVELHALPARGVEGVGLAMPEVS